jgi:hypothetical protein
MGVGAVAFHHRQRGREEDAIQLSLGIKNGGGTLRLKIPLSF